MLFLEICKSGRENIFQVGSQSQESCYCWSNLCKSGQGKHIPGRKPVTGIMLFLELCKSGRENIFQVGSQSQESCYSGSYAYSCRNNMFQLGSQLQQSCYSWIFGLLYNFKLVHTLRPSLIRMLTLIFQLNELMFFVYFHYVLSMYGMTGRSTVLFFQCVANLVKKNKI